MCVSSHCKKSPRKFRRCFFCLYLLRQLLGQKFCSVVALWLWNIQFKLWLRRWVWQRWSPLGMRLRCSTQRKHKMLYKWMYLIAFVWCGICTIFSHFTCYVRKTECIKNHLLRFVFFCTNKNIRKTFGSGYIKLGPPFYNVQY